MITIGNRNPYANHANPNYILFSACPYLSGQPLFKAAAFKGTYSLIQFQILETNSEH